MALDDASLRAAASHRGLKLVKSRKRTAGVGDYGLFGLSDAAGKPLYGVGDDGALTATAKDIAAYLRQGEASTWAESARTTPARKTPKPPPRGADEEEAASSAIRARPAKTTRREPPAAAARPKAAAEPRRTPTPPRTTREAKPADAKALATLLRTIGGDRPEAEVRRAIRDAIARKEPILLAEQVDIVGCLAWATVPGVLHGPIARITTLVVEEGHRRAGVGQMLFNAAAALFASRKIARVEMMSDIAVRNANGFLRALGLEQASYRFVATL